MYRQPKLFSTRYAGENPTLTIVRSFSYVASLDRYPTVHKIGRAPAISMQLHRFEESIGGRAYTIEVKAVAHDRWRAYIVRIPGVPTALMPFYGATPADAA